MCSCGKWMVPLSLVFVFCFHAYIFPHFLIFSLNSTTHFWQHCERKLPSPLQESLLQGAFRNVGLQIKSSIFPSAFLFSVLRMETFLSPNVKINGQFLTSNTSLLGSVSNLCHLISFTMQCQALAVYSLCSWWFHPVPYCQVLSPAICIFEL